MAPSTMRAAVLREYNSDYELSDVPIPTPKSYELLLKTGAAGLCHTDGMVVAGDFHSPLPIIGSHEPVGTVVGMGADVPSTKWAVGMRVAALPSSGPCGKCPDCLNGLSHTCDRHEGMVGISSNGAFAEYVLVDHRSSVVLPDSISFPAAAPLCCAGATIYNAILRCELKAGQTLAIVGIGALGHIGVQIAKVMGLRVVAIDARSEPLDLAKGLRHAPDLTIDTRDGLEAALGSLKRLEPGKLYAGVDAAIVATDPLPAFDFAVKVLAKHGTLLMVGQPAKPVGFSYLDIIFRDIKVKGSLLSSPQVFQELVDLVAEHEIEIKTQSYKLDDVMDMVHDSHKPDMKGKFVVEF